MVDALSGEPDMVECMVAPRWGVHSRPPACFTDRLGVIAVILATFNIRLHVLGRNQADWI
jgi:hypothetical protein